jgi:hypothetical protein
MGGELCTAAGELILLANRFHFPPKRPTIDGAALLTALRQQTEVESVQACSIRTLRAQTGAVTVESAAEADLMVEKFAEVRCAC